MKYLKLFEELKSQTYNRAAAKLKQMGHERRSKELYDWSAIVQKREALEKWSKLGTFGLTQSGTLLQKHQHLSIYLMVNFILVWKLIQIISGKDFQILNLIQNQKTPFGFCLVMVFIQPIKKLMIKCFQMTK